MHILGKSAIEWVSLCKNSTLLAGIITEKWSEIKQSVSQIFLTHTQSPRFTMGVNFVECDEKSIVLTYNTVLPTRETLKTNNLKCTV